MKLLAVLIAVILTGCIQQKYDYKITHPDVVYVGDSLCYKVYDTDSGNDLVSNEDWKKTSEREAGVVVKCRPNRKSIDINEIPQRTNGNAWRVAFLALGTNDVRTRVPIEQFRTHYQFLVYNANADIIYCVMPQKKVLGKSSEEYRQVIAETCANVIYPEDYGVLFLAKDGIHKTKTDHKRWWPAIYWRI